MNMQENMNNIHKNTFEPVEIDVYKLAGNVKIVSDNMIRPDGIVFEEKEDVITIGAE